MEEIRSIWAPDFDSEFKFKCMCGWELSMQIDRETMTAHAGEMYRFKQKVIDHLVDVKCGGGDTFIDGEFWRKYE